MWLSLFAQELTNGVDIFAPPLQLRLRVSPWQRMPGTSWSFFLRRSRFCGDWQWWLMMLLFEEEKTIMTIVVIMAQDGGNEYFSIGTIPIPREIIILWRGSCWKTNTTIHACDWKLQIPKIMLKTIDNQLHLQTLQNLPLMFFSSAQQCATCHYQDLLHSPF